MGANFTLCICQMSHICVRIIVPNSLEDCCFIGQTFNIMNHVCQTTLDYVFVNYVLNLHMWFIPDRGRILDICHKFLLLDPRANVHQKGYQLRWSDAQRN